MLKPVFGHNNHGVIFMNRRKVKRALILAVDTILLVKQIQRISRDISDLANTLDDMMEPAK